MAVVPQVFSIAVTPTIDAGAYASGDNIGAAMTVTSTRLTEVVASGRTPYLTGLGGQLVVGGMNLKVVQKAVAALVASGMAVAGNQAGNCWTGVKVSEEPVEANQDEPVAEGGAGPTPARNPLMRMFGR